MTQIVKDRKSVIRLKMERNKLCQILFRQSEYFGSFRVPSNDCDWTRERKRAVLQRYRNLLLYSGRGGVVTDSSVGEHLRRRLRNKDSCVRSRREDLLQLWLFTNIFLHLRDVTLVTPKAGQKIVVLTISFPWYFCPFFSGLGYTWNKVDLLED